MAQTIRDAQTQRALEENCTVLDADVFADNFPSLISQLKDGFAVTGVEIYREGSPPGIFRFSKRIDGKETHDRKHGPIGELQEISLAELWRADHLLQHGWLGIDIKNLGDVRDPDPAKWNLILEKQKSTQ